MLCLFPLSQNQELQEPDNIMSLWDIMLLKSTELLTVTAESVNTVLLYRFTIIISVQCITQFAMFYIRTRLLD